ncbi:MAG: hypothetical protein ACPH9T_06195 [Paracoccaceae bacterium]
MTNLNQPASQSLAVSARSLDMRSVVTGGALVALSLVVLFLLDTGVDSQSTFKLSRPRDVWAIGNLVVPSYWVNLAITAVLAFLGFRQFAKGGAKWRTLSLAAGLTLFVICMHNYHKVASSGYRLNSAQFTSSDPNLQEVLL